MAKRLTYGDRKKMIEARDKGLTDAEIKAHFGFTDDRTLKRHLRLAEQEQEARQVKIEILKDALASHLTEVRSLLEQWQGLTAVPPIYQSPSSIAQRKSLIESNPLFDSMRAHAPSPTLWRDYATWDRKLSEYVSNYQKLIREAEENAGKWEGVRRLADGFSEPILKQVSEKAADPSRKASSHKFEKRVEYLHKGGGPVPEYEILLVDGSKTIETDDASAYEAQYKSLSDQVVNGETAGSLASLYNDLKALERKMHGSIQLILLRRDYIVYTCKLCPGQAKLLR